MVLGSRNASYSTSNSALVTNNKWKAECGEYFRGSQLEQITARRYKRNAPAHQNRGMYARKIELITWMQMLDACLRILVVSAKPALLVLVQELQLLWWMWPTDPQKLVMWSDNGDENVNRLTADCVPEYLTQLCPFPAPPIGRLLIATLDNSNWIVNEMKLSAWPSLQSVLKGQFSQTIL